VTVESHQITITSRGAFLVPHRGASMLLALAILAFVSAVSPTHASDRIYTVTIHDLPYPGSMDYPSFQAWFAAHPEIRPARHVQLRIRTLERGSLLMAIAGGTAPDILRVYHHEAKAWIRNGFFEPLDRYIYRDKNGDGRYTEGVDEVIWKPFLAIPPKLRAMIIDDGHIYIVPRFQWIQYMVYRRDIMADAGLDPDKYIATWDEFVRICRILTDPKARIPGARAPVGRKGIGIYPNGWIWQGFLYSYGGESLYYIKKCPHCGAENRFPQDAADWHCSKCGADLRDAPALERAHLDSPEARKAVKLWHDMLWQPFVKCPHCGEPVTVGEAGAQVPLPLHLTCPKCGRKFDVTSKDDVIVGCARACVDDDSNWRELWTNGEIVFVPYYRIDWLAESNLDPRAVGTMPFPGKGGASAFHYYGVYAGARNREGGEDRVRVCAQMILDYASQFYVPREDPDYLKYDRAKIRFLVNNGFYTLCSHDELTAAGLGEYARELSPAVRRLQDMIRDPNHYKILPISEGYSRVQQEILGFVMLSGICTNPHFDIDGRVRLADRLANTQVFMKDEIVRELSRKYRGVFVAALVLLIAYVAVLVRAVLLRRSEDAKPATADLARRLTPGKRLAGVVMLLPAASLVALWAYYPLVRGSIMAFQDVRVMGGSRFVGIENFIRVLTNPLFPTVMKATLIYVVAVLTLGFMTPVFLAIMLSEIRRGSTLFRTIFYAPNVLGGVVVLFIWRIFYMPTPDGLLNHVIGWFGLGPVRWLENPAINKWLLALPGIWAGTGAACLVYLAALKSIDTSLYEAADIDGAGVLAKVMHITLPSLKPLLIINFVGAFIGAFRGMGNILVLTGGAFETNVIGLQIFMEAFGYLRFGSSTALAWILGSLLVGFTIFQLGFLRRVEFRRAA